MVRSLPSISKPRFRSPDMVTYACYPSEWEMEGGESEVQGVHQLGSGARKEMHEEE